MRDFFFLYHPLRSSRALSLLGASVEKKRRRLSRALLRGSGLEIGARAGAFVVRAESNEAVTRMLLSLPAWGVWEWDVTPLESFGHRAELEKKTIARMRAARQLARGRSGKLGCCCCGRPRILFAGCATVKGVGFGAW